MLPRVWTNKFSVRDSQKTKSAVSVGLLTQTIEAHKKRNTTFIVTETLLCDIISKFDIET